MELGTPGALRGRHRLGPQADQPAAKEGLRTQAASTLSGSGSGTTLLSIAPQEPSPLGEPPWQQLVWEQVPWISLPPVLTPVLPGAAGLADPLWGLGLRAWGKVWFCLFLFVCSEPLIAGTMFEVTLLEPGV